MLISPYFYSETTQEGLTKDRVLLIKIIWQRGKLLCIFRFTFEVDFANSVLQGAGHLFK